MILFSSFVKMNELFSLMFKEEKSFSLSVEISTLIIEYFFSSILMYSPIFNKIEHDTFLLPLKASKIWFRVLIKELASNLNSGIDGS